MLCIICYKTDARTVFLFVTKINRDSQVPVATIIWTIYGFVISHDVVLNQVT